MNEAGIALKAPCATRWLSKYKMVRRFFANHHLVEEALIVFDHSEETMEQFLSITEQGFFNDYMTVLEPINEMVIELQVYVT